jgi:hypothetical protein
LNFFQTHSFGPEGLRPRTGPEGPVPTLAGRRHARRTSTCRRGTPAPDPKDPSLRPVPGPLLQPKPGGRNVRRERAAVCPKARHHPTGTPEHKYLGIFGIPEHESLGISGVPGHKCLGTFGTPELVYPGTLRRTRQAPGGARTTPDGGWTRRPAAVPSRGAPKGVSRGGLASGRFAFLGPEGPGSAGWPDYHPSRGPGPGSLGRLGAGCRSSLNRDSRSRGSPPGWNRQGRLQPWFRGRLATPLGKPRISLHACQRQGIPPKRLLPYPRVREFRTPCGRAG